jgi:hypothetical protein
MSKTTDITDATDTMARTYHDRTQVLYDCFQGYGKAQAAIIDRGSNVLNGDALFQSICPSNKGGLYLLYQGQAYLVVYNEREPTTIDIYLTQSLGIMQAVLGSRSDRAVHEAFTKAYQAGLELYLNAVIKVRNQTLLLPELQSLLLTRLSA